MGNLFLPLSLPREREKNSRPYQDLLFLLFTILCVLGSTAGRLRRSPEATSGRLLPSSCPGDDLRRFLITPLPKVLVSRQLPFSPVAPLRERVPPWVDFSGPFFSPLFGEQTPSDNLFELGLSRLYFQARAPPYPSFSPCQRFLPVRPTF